MSDWLGSVDWLAVVSWAAWMALLWVTLRMAFLGAIYCWQGARAILRAVRTLRRVTLAKRGVRS